MMFFFSTCYSQGWETFGKGVIDFLRTNPKTASRINANEAAALNVISDVLRTSAQRKHDINVAKTGRSEIIINTGSNHQATVYSDIQGNVYLLYNGTIYPISSDLVNQAKSESGESANEYEPPIIKNVTLQNFNLSTLKNEYRFEKTKKIGTKKHFFNNDEQVTLCDIARRYNVPLNQLTIAMYYPRKDVYYIHQRTQVINELYSCHKKFIGRKNGTAHYSGDRYVASAGLIVLVPIYSFSTEIVSIFTCNWAKDFDGKGFGFDDFQGIKRSFDKDESLAFVMGYTSEHSGTWKLEVYEVSSGKTIFEKTGTANKGGQIVGAEKGSVTWSPGVYMYNFTLMTPGNDLVSKREKFEILDNTDN